MDFSGWLKLTLVDYDNHIATTFFTAGCNFRCPFCHNSDLVLRPKETPTIPWSELMAYLKKRQGILDGVCITGGEPTLMPDLEEKIKDIKSLGYHVKLDTNGSNPDVLKRLLDQNLLDYVAMDIKNSEAKYSETIGLTNVDMDKIKQSISLIKTMPDYEFRTTIIDEFHSEESIRQMAELTNGAKKMFLQHYIDSEHCIQHGFHEVDKEKATHFADILNELGIPTKLRGY